MSISRKLNCCPHRGFLFRGKFRSDALPLSDFHESGVDYLRDDLLDAAVRLRELVQPRMGVRMDLLKRRGRTIRYRHPDTFSACSWCVPLLLILDVYAFRPTTTPNRDRQSPHAIQIRRALMHFRVSASHIADSRFGMRIHNRHGP
eukprot:1183436-Prorocentrum_minimum.AAC.2